MPVQVSPGQSVVFNATFRKLNGSPLTGTAAAVFSVLDYNGTTVLTGTGTQDLTDAAKWSATVTLPASTPVPANSNDRYSIVWRLPRSNGADAYFTEQFSVIERGDQSFLPRPTEVIALQGRTFTDTIVLPVDATDVSYEVRNEYNITLTTYTPTSISEGADLRWTVTGGSDLPAPTGNNGYHLGVWSWTASTGDAENEIHPIYLLNTQAAAMVHNLRQFVDRARMKEISPFLEWKDSDLFHFILRGFELCNSWPPSITNWSIAAIPYGLSSFIEIAGALQACQAQYLAEGMQQFDFQGLENQLQVDRTAYLDNLANQLNGLLERLDAAKRNWIGSGSPTVQNGGVVGSGRVIGAFNTTSTRLRNYRFPYPVIPAGSPGGPIAGMLIGSSPTMWWNGFTFFGPGGGNLG